MNKYVAVDLGAESGRVIVGNLQEIDIVHRFPNKPIRIGDSIFWNILGIFGEIKKGLKNAFEKYPKQIRSIGIDTWGVDFGLLDSEGVLIGNPYHYRDRRTDGMMDRVFSEVSRDKVYRETGVQFMQINTLYQLFSFARNKPGLFKAAKHFLTIPDLLNYWLTGIMKNEYSIATTTQLYNPSKRAWSENIIEELNLKREIFNEIVMPGTEIGKLLPHITEETGAGPDVAVIAPGCHDTACAVASVPSTGQSEYAYLSSGTWSLLGIESPRPVISGKSLEYNFTNEGAADGGIRVLKNIMGLWILQECRRFWTEQGKEYSYARLADMAEAAGTVDFRIDPDDPRFLKPGLIDNSMADRIREYCRETEQKPPESDAGIVRGILESLADKYAVTIHELEEISGRSIEKLYIIGGGSRNSLLCRLTADASGITVYAGPVEATALGNIMIQSLSAAEIGSISQGRGIIRENFGVKKYLPETG